MITGLLANCVTLFIMITLHKKEKISYRDTIKFIKAGWRKDLLLVIGTFIKIGPLSTFAPMILSKILWGN